MNVLFLTLARISDISVRGIYTDLIRQFIKHGHTVYVVVPAERRFAESTAVWDSHGAKILRVWTLNIQKTNLIEKGIGTLLLEYQFQNAIQKYWRNIKFDLIMYSTPPITFNRIITSLKKRDQARTYLLLKDIFPQNAIDLGMFPKGGMLYHFFRNKEEYLYQLSDYIGCMSPANAEYVLKHNPKVPMKKVQICPNCIELADIQTEYLDKKQLLQELQIPIDKRLFIYGGNLGRPQGVDFLIEILEANETRFNSYFVIIGGGTEYKKIKRWFEENQPRNACLLSSLPKQEYDNIVKCCDVGLIFLDKRFTIPNYPSRLLSYLECRMPVLMGIDVHTDIGRIAESNGYGLWTENGNLVKFMELVDFMLADKERIKIMGERGYSYLVNNYTVERAYQIIMTNFL